MVGGRDPKTVDWHKGGRPEPIKSKMAFIRRICGGVIIMGLFPLGLGIYAKEVFLMAMGLVMSGGALAILIQWELIKKTYAKNYKKNLRQWKKTRNFDRRRN
ncbi:MAG: hypothetical protein F9K46_07010 [Anaerolineae bacterium]|nr:MAG: hypothetical protein F9K46_07010 [Anaerolineae bacterium]